MIVSTIYHMKTQVHPDGGAPCWVNLLLEEHAWISAGLIWMPTINRFELWEFGVHLLRKVSGRDYWFPRSMVVQCVWLQSTQSVSLRDAVRNVTHHVSYEERDPSRSGFNCKRATTTHQLGSRGSFPKSTKPFTGVPS